MLFIPKINTSFKITLKYIYIYIYIYKAFSFDAASLAHPAVQASNVAVKRHSDGVTVLGIPHGSDLFIQRELSTIVDKTELGLHELRHLAWYHREDSMQCALLLLRYCAVPRFSHVLRALSPNTVAAASAHHDAIMNSLQRQCR
jgi:hypothetical protein